MDLITILPVVTKDLPISPRFTPYNFLLRCKFSTLITRQPIVEFYLLTSPRSPLRKKEHKSYFGKNRIHDFRTSSCAGYLLDHSGDELQRGKGKNPSGSCQIPLGGIKSRAQSIGTSKSTPEISLEGNRVRFPQEELKVEHRV